MREFSKKALTLLLSLMLMLSMSAGIVFAGDEQADEGQVVEQVAPEEAVIEDAASEESEEEAVEAPTAEETATEDVIEEVPDVSPLTRDVSEGSGESGAFSGTITVIDANGESKTITGEEIKAAGPVDVAEDTPWKFNVSETSAGTACYGRFYSMKSVLETAGVDCSEAHGIRATADDGAFQTGYTKEEVENLYIFDQSEVIRGGKPAGEAGTYGLGIKDTEGNTKGNKWPNSIQTVSVANDHVIFKHTKRGCQHYCAICGEDESSIKVIDSDGEAKTIHDCEIRAAGEEIVEETAPWKFNVSETSAGTACYGKFYSMKSVLETAGVDYSEAHGIKATADDGAFQTGYSKEEVEDLYIFDQSEVIRGGKAAGKAGTYGLGIKDTEGTTAGNKWPSSVQEVSVASSHVLFIKKGKCSSHKCTICGEPEHSVSVEGSETPLYDCQRADAEAAVELVNGLPSELNDENKKDYEDAVKAYEALSDSAKAYLAETAPVTVAKYEAAAAKLDAADAHEAQAAAEDKTNAVIALSSNLVKAAVIELNKSKYTTGSYNTFAEALEVANTAIGNTDSTAADITAANTSLDAAIAGLVEKSANPLKVTPKTATVKYTSVKKKTQYLAVKKVLTVSKNQGTVTYVKSSGNSKIAINKTNGKITVKKGLKKGTYSVKVKVTAAGNGNYKAGTKTVTFKIRVK